MIDVESSQGAAAKGNSELDGVATEGDHAEGTQAGRATCIWGKRPVQIESISTTTTMTGWRRCDRTTAH